MVCGDLIHYGFDTTFKWSQLLIKMLCRRRGRPRKNVPSCIAALTSSQKVQLRKIGKVLRRKQLKLWRQRIIQLTTTNVCSKVTKHNLSSIRDLKNFARQLGRTTIHDVHHLWQKRANGIFKDRKSSSQCRNDHVYWKNIESRNMATETIIFEDIHKNKDDKSPIDVHMDQWVGVEVHLFGRKNSIGEVGSTTSNVCDKLRSVVVDPEREDMHLSLIKKRDKQEDRKCSIEENEDIVPCWVSCRRSITKISAFSGISNDHIATLLASLPKTRSYIDDNTTIPINILSTKEIGLHACVNDGVLLVDQSSIATIPMEQSFSSQASIVNLYKDSSLNFDPKKEDNISMVHADTIQVCPTTPEKAQKRRRSYKDIIPYHSNNTNMCEQSNDKLFIGDSNNFKEASGQVYLTDYMSPNSMEIESSCNSTRIHGRGSNVVTLECISPLIDSMPLPSIAYPLESMSHVASTILDPIQESSQLLQSREPSTLVVVMDDDDKGVIEGGEVLLTNSLSSYSIDFESSCNSTKVGKQDSNVVVVEHAGLLVESTPTPTIVVPYASVSQIATLPIDLVEDSSQIFQVQVPTAPIFVAKSKKRKGKRAKSKLTEDFGGIAKISKVQKKYKPRVAKVKQIDKCSARQLQNETNEYAKVHGEWKHARTKKICNKTIKQGMHKKRNNCVPQNPLNCNKTIKESEKLFHQEESLTQRLPKEASKPITSSISLGKTPLSTNHACITSSVEEYLANLHPPNSFDLGHDRFPSNSLLCNPCLLKQRCIIHEGSHCKGLIKHTNNLSISGDKDQMMSNLFIERQKQFEALSTKLSNKVITLLDLPSVEQSHSFYNDSIVEELLKQSTFDALNYYEEIDLSKKNTQARDEYNNTSSLSDEWTAYHVGSVEMTALDAFNEEEMRCDMFSKEKQLVVQGNIHFQNFNSKLNEYLTSDTTDSWVRESIIVGDRDCGVSGNLLCEIDELGDGSLMQPNPSPSSIHQLFKTQMVYSEPLEERTMSSFYASTSTEVNEIMLNRLNKMIEDNCQKDVSEIGNAEQDLDYVDVSLNYGQTNESNLYLLRKPIKRCKSMGLLGDNCSKEEDLMKVRNSLICQMQSQFQNPDPSSTLMAEIDVVPIEQNPEILMNMRDKVLSQMRSQFQDPDPDSTFSTENDDMLVEENHDDKDNLSKMSDIVFQVHSHSPNLDPNSSSFQIESTIVPIQDTHEIIEYPINTCKLGFQFHDANPNPNFVRENTTIFPVEASDKILGEKNHNTLSPRNATLSPTSSSQINSSLEKRPFHLMTFIQLVEYIRTILVNTSLENSPLKLSCHLQSHDQLEEEKREFEKILRSINTEQLQKLMDLAELDFSSIMKLGQFQKLKGQDEDENQLLMEVIKCQQEKKQDNGASEENNLEVILNEQIEGNEDQDKEDNLLIDLDPSTKQQTNFKVIKDPSTKEARDEDPSLANKEVNHVTDIVPFVGNAIVAYDSSFLTLRQKKPRPKVNLDSETIRVWKLLMGKIESTENDPQSLDNELKWKQERLVMQKQANTFIQRMHLIQGDRSFSRWKGSIVDSVIGVFLTQNVSDVLSSSAYMCLRARFPLGQDSFQSNSLKSVSKEIFQRGDNVWNNPKSFQTLNQEIHNSCFHNASTNCAPNNLANEGQEEICHSQDCCIEENNTPNLDLRQVNTSLFPWSAVNPSSLTLRQNDTSLINIHFEQPSIIDTSMNHMSKECLELIVNENKNSTALDLEINTQENIFFLQSKKNENQEPLMTSNLEQGVNNFKLINSQPESQLHCMITQSESCSLTKEVMVSNLESLESQLALSTSIHLRKEELITGLERARLEAEQVCARKSCKWNALSEKYNAKCQQAALDAAMTLPHTEMAEDGVDWEAVRCADLEEIADAIKERGMNWKLAGRIKGFLERLRLEQGSINLEWLRSIPSDDAKEFLSSVHGLGLKSVECIRLLTLHHLAFPVDTNVGRICVRLGWVPLEPLPEELQLHVLELYPVQATIQKYLWPRLCTLDQQTLYELHYQLITFGKVFCTKSKPNCNACPMRGDCKHFASALASAKLALPPPEENSSGAGAPLAIPPKSSVFVERIFEAFLPTNKPVMQPSMNISQYCQPIIEEPTTPESEVDMSDFDIEDYPFSVEEVPHETMIEMIIQRIIHGRQSEMSQQFDNYNFNHCFQFDNLSTTFLETSVAQSEMDMIMEDFIKEVPASLPQQMMVSSKLVDCGEPIIVDCEELEKDCVSATTISTLFNDAPSKEVVMVPPEVASLPVPKLKNIERLRTVHYVYELPDDHPLLERMDVREADDPCFYLLAIWSPGEVPESIPNINDNNEETGFNLSNDEESIKATLLVPCRTAMKGNFPLNGTYFQVNEVFADHESSLQPILVPRIFLWNLRRRFVYFGTSVTSILRGMTTEEIQACFWRGYVCVRGFDRMTRAPKPLVHRLHFQTTKSIMKSGSLKNTKT